MTDDEPGRPVEEQGESFDPPEAERFEAGEEVRIRFPREGVQLLPAKR